MNEAITPDQAEDAVEWVKRSYLLWECFSSCVDFEKLSKDEIHDLHNSIFEFCQKWDFVERGKK